MVIIIFVGYIICIYSIFVIINMYVENRKLLKWCDIIDFGKTELILQ